MSKALPQVQTVSRSIAGESALKIITGMASVAGIVLAWFLFLRSPGYVRTLSESRSGALVRRLWLAGWGFDWIYDTFIVKPFVWASKVNRDDFIDLIYLGVIWTCRGLNRTLSLTQAGKLRWYAAGIAMGAVVLLGFVVFS